MRRLTLKPGDAFLRQERGRGLVPMPDFSKKIKEDPTLLWGNEEFFNKSIEDGVLEVGKVYFIWRASRKAYLPVYFDEGFAFVEI